MDTTDKHPPADPKRWSTNKRVKALGENIFGTKVLEAAGAKRVRPGDGNATSANFQPAGETELQRQAREARELALRKESFLSEQQNVQRKRGYTTSTENKMMNALKDKGNRT